MSLAVLDHQALIEAAVHLGDYELRFEASEFGSEFEEQARNELRETQENAEQALNQLRSLIKDEPGLKFSVDDDARLLIFLRPCKFYVESAMALLRRHYKFQLKHPKYFQDLLPSSELAPFEQSLITILPLRNKNGERVLIVEPGQKWKPKECSLLEIVRSMIVLLHAAVQEPRTQVAGTHIILDMEGLGLNHVWQFTPSIAKDIVDFVQECLPLRLKGIHIVNQPYVFNMVYAVFKPFLGEKLRSRIYFHGTDYAAMHKEIDQKILPLKYDGSADIPMNEGMKLHSYIVAFEQEFKVKAHDGYTAKVK